jgi:protein-L-isoaspartate(D-aspartate) O-methyltransferase
MDRYHLARKRMVRESIVPRGIKDPEVIRALSTIPRHFFVDEALRERAYGDYPLPIGDKQTISQPFIVARMTEALKLSGDEKILEIGTGSGYQTAVLAEIGERVVSLERIPALAKRARGILDKLGYHRVVIHISDGTMGWRDDAPYDAIVVTAGAPAVPEKLVEQLVVGGRLVIPVGDQNRQNLVRLTKTSEGEEREDLGGCVFVPLIGTQGWPG